MNRTLYSTLTATWHQLWAHYRTPTILTSCSIIVASPFIWKRLTYKAEHLPPPPKDHPYRLHLVDDHSTTITLPDGRRLGYAQYGDLSGKPIIYLHGILGSRLESALMHDNAKDLGLRIIAIDRPGIGLSSPDRRPLKERRIIDLAQDVEALVKHLELDEYAVLGMSGGGPYALVCAAALPSSTSKPRLKAISIVTGLGLADMSQPWPAPLVWLNRNLELRWLMKRMFTGGKVWDMSLSDFERMEAMRTSFDVRKAHPADLEVARHPRKPEWDRVFLRSSREAVKQGFDGFLDDAAILSKADSGFRVDGIRADLPVQLWYGTDDTNINPKAGEETASRLRGVGNGKVELHMIVGETHGSVQVKFQREILEGLRRVMQEE